MIYLYAFTDRPELPLPSWQKLGQSHLDRQELQIIVYRDLAAIYSYIPTSRLRPDPVNIWQHESVVEALMSERTVLPARFGSILESEARLQASMEVLYPDLLANMKRLAGRVEVSLHVLWKPPASEDNAPAEIDAEKETPASGAPQTGSDYMLDRLRKAQQQLALRQSAKGIAAKLHASLERLADENHIQVLPTQGLLLKAAYLVKREQVDLFRQEVDRLSAANSSDAWAGSDPGLNFVCTGPWPPYSFITALKPTPNPLFDAAPFDL